MKNILALLLFILPFTCFAQDPDTYGATNGKIYHVGDTLKLALGSMPDGHFKYVQVSSPIFLPPRRNTNDLNATKDMANVNVVIRKIRSVKQRTGAAKTIFVTRAGGGPNYDIWIEEAIAACEVTPCTNEKNNVATTAQSSVADELLKLKKLLDAGAITQNEFNAQKKKLLAQ